MFAFLIRMIVILVILNIIKKLVKNLIGVNKPTSQTRKFSQKDVFNAKFTHVEKE